MKNLSKRTLAVLRFHRHRARAIRTVGERSVRARRSLAGKLASPIRPAKARVDDDAGDDTGYFDACLTF